MFQNVQKIISPDYISTDNKYNYTVSVLNSYSSDADRLFWKVICKICSAFA